MSIVELIPLNKGNRVILNEPIITTIGRTPNIGCLDNKISRNHAQLSIKSDGTVWIKSIHHNPTFYKTKTNQIVTLTRDKEYQLYNDDQFGLLPDEYFYRVSIKPKDEEIEIKSNQNHSTIPKSPVQDIPIIEKHDEQKLELENDNTSQTTRSLPAWMSDNSATTSKLNKTQSKEKTASSTPSIRHRINPGGRKSKGIIYDDDDEEESTAVASSTDQASTSNNINTVNNSQTSSIAANSTKRERCPYGETCYRTNPAHRAEVMHPGDPDWNDADKKQKPECPYGNECYRKNPDHLKEYHHAKKGYVAIKTKRRTTKRKASDDEDDDDDGLPNEYDYNDSFIDDETLDDSVLADREEVVESDDDIEWKPTKHGRFSDNTDDDSSDDSERDLAKKEAEEFIKSSTTDRHGPVIKKRRVDAQDEDEDDDDDD